MRRFTLGCLVLFCLVSYQLEAAPITWRYTGSVTSTPDTNWIPLGAPAVLYVTPSDVNTAPPTFPANVGQYWFNMTVDVAGYQFTGTGAFEVNYDIFYGHPMPGHVLYRYTNWAGPCLTNAVAYHLCGSGNPRAGLITNPADFSSPALLMPLYWLQARVQFGYPPLFLDITASNGQRVPEPVAPSMVSLGLLAAIWRRHRR